MLGKLTAADFTPYLDQKFQIQLPEKKLLTVFLTEVSINKNLEAWKGRQPFSIIFRGPPDCELTQGMYPVSHNKLGELQLFLVPVGPDDKGMCFEAVFN